MFDARAPEVVSADVTKDAQSTDLDLAAGSDLFRRRILARFTGRTGEHARTTAARLTAAQVECSRCT